MKSCALAAVLNLIFVASLLDAADTTAFVVSVYACRPGSGDCTRIIWQNHLSDIPCDSVVSSYPVYLVIVSDLHPPSGWAQSPEVVIGNQRVDEYGSWRDSAIQCRIYCDSMLDSSAGKTVLILPAYPQDHVQKGLFPGVAIIDSIKSTAKKEISSLPSIAEVWDATSAIGRYADANSRLASISPVVTDRAAMFNLRGERIGTGQISGCQIICKNGLFKRVTLAGKFAAKR